jgi:hypothetical protein
VIVPGSPPHGSRATEGRLDRLREEAGRTGRVTGTGLPVVGGPIPRDTASPAGYYGQPILKPPVWTWQVGLYFFVGGTSGMSGVIALASLLTGQPLDFVRAALGVALAGALLSPALLIWDLGRPARFLSMLRVFKWRSAMSMGVWTLLTFGAFAGAAFLHGTSLVLVAGTALSGVILATYTGVLLGATAVPVWSAHHRLLPFHFGVVGLGSAAAVLELLGYRMAALDALGLGVAAVETGVGAWTEICRPREAARAMRRGTPGVLLRTAVLLTGPGALVLRLLGGVTIAASGFLIGALCSRYGWLLAGRASANDAEETIAAQSCRA